MSVVVFVSIVFPLCIVVVVDAVHHYKNEDSGRSAGNSTWEALTHNLVALLLGITTGVTALIMLPFCK